MCLAYALFEIPSNVVIRRLGARYWLGFLITAWGACVLGMGFVHSWQALTVLRALLGMFEAGRKQRFRKLGNVETNYRSISRCNLYHRIVVSPVRNG